MPLLRLLLLGGLVLLAGCANLKEVREFAFDASRLSAYPDLTHRWAQTYEREKVYLFDKDLALAKSEDQARREAAKDLLKIHKTVALYFAILGKLAGDDTFSLDGNIDDLAKQIKESKLTGIEVNHVEAYANIAEIVSSSILSGYRQHEIAKYLERGNAPMQTMLAGMRQVIKVYVGTLRNEKGRMGFLNLVDQGTPQNKIVAALANAEYARLAAEAETAQRRLTTLDKAIDKIAGGHQTLYDARNDFGRSEVKSLLQSLNKDIKSLRNELKTLKE